MRLLSVVAIAGLLVACGRPIDVRGLYVNDDGAGALVPCDQPKTLLTVTDSGLATRYRREATKPNEPLFLHLRGVRTDSGSIYGGTRHLGVCQVVEGGARGGGGGPNRAKPASSVFPRALDPATGPL